MDYRFTTLDEAVATAMTITPGATDEHKTVFRQWVWEGLKQIGPTNHWVKTCELRPKNFSFKKPSDLASTLAIALYDTGGAEIAYNWQETGGRVHTDRSAVRSGGNGLIDLSEDAYYFHMSSDAVNVGYAVIRYLATPVDSNGLPLIPEDHVLALSMFCRWLWAMRNGTNQSEIQLSRDTWYREKDRIFGDNKMPSVFRANQFAKNKFLSLINSFKPNSY
jgi:hypothetical protein